MTSPGEGVTVFTSLYLSAGAPALGEAKGLINRETCYKIYLACFMAYIKELINPLASPSAGAPAIKYGDVNTETTSPGEVKGLMKI